jgi:hypothetical protein
LLADLRRVGVALSIKGDRLAFDAPAGTMTPELRALMVTCKPELLAVLAGDYLIAAATLVKRVLDPDKREALINQFDERAAILELDGNTSRGDAERQAYIAMARAVEREGRDLISPRERGRELIKGNQKKSNAGAERAREIEQIRE